MIREHRLAATNIATMIRQAALKYPDKIAFRFFSAGKFRETLTYGDLHERATRIASGLRTHARPGEPVVLSFPAGLEFIEALAGCFYAGVIATPVAWLPVVSNAAVQDPLCSILRDCGARVVLGELEVAERLQKQLSANVIALPLATLRQHAASGAYPGFQLEAADLAILQYTSGSTGSPKGVMVTHGNVLENMRRIADASGSGSDAVILSWLPHHHDFGLFCVILHTCYVAGGALLMAPMEFLKRPARWMQLASEHGITETAAPNFAFQLSARAARSRPGVPLDLSRLRSLFCASEPISAAVVRGFLEHYGASALRLDSFKPGYGLAEATIYVAADTAPGRRTAAELLRADENGVERVSCGKVATDDVLAIVDPATRQPKPMRSIGEIWFSGAGVAAGYWQRPDETEAVFGAQLASHPGRRFLRTGDLGFLHEGRLFVCGRLKETLNIHGRNFYPNDIEDGVIRLEPRFRPGQVAVITEADGSGDQTIVVAEAFSAAPDELAHMRAVIAEAVLAMTGAKVADVQLVRPGSLPRTTSGKLKRSRVRTLYRERGFDTWPPGETVVPALTRLLREPL